MSRGYYERTELSALKLIQAYNQSLGYAIDQNMVDTERQQQFSDLIHQVQAEHMGVEPDECIVYEDSDSGLEAARQAGMRWIDVRVLWQE